MRITERFPWLYPVRVQQKRISRHIANILTRQRFSRKTEDSSLFPYTCKKHQSVLRRKLGDSDPLLQEKKITNLKIASSQIDGVVIKPGETFSFWKLVGKPTRKKGYIEGMLLSQGEVITGIGGGICQLANLLYWMALHTPMEVVERHHHSFDPFPDDGRVLPFGSGAGVFYNYVDLRFYNSTEQSFLIHVWLTDKHLKGAIYTDQDWPYSYHIFEENHRFYKEKDKVIRTNDIWRKVIDKRTGQCIKKEFLIHNCAEVKYQVPEAYLSRS
ncbi:MAG: VanW family protein [Bacillaceae bacterium]|nr:VanW family protein [Bacillaceae bacterium]